MTIGMRLMINFVLRLVYNKLLETFLLALAPSFSLTCNALHLCKNCHCPHAYAHLIVIAWSWRGLQMLLL